MLKLAAIVGPTASGKTSLAIEIAQRINAEIISCDSMQVYRGMDIGTAKANVGERSLVSHHLIDVVDIDQDFNVAQYQGLARQTIADINGRGKLPLLVGGTGLYYQAVVDNYHFFPMESRTNVRQKWESIIKEKGLEYAYNLLKEVDYPYSQLISNNDQKRIVRALEVYELTGQPFSSFQQRDRHTYKLALVGLYLQRPELYERIDKRVDEMIAQGLIEEVAALRDSSHYQDDLNSMQALGYKQVIAYLNGFIDREGMIEEIKRETRRFAKRQLTWFKKDKRIYWVEVGHASQKEIILEKISTYIEGQLYTV
ncbi:MAG: tRNA (adenosine(37)-N6)-dimethylallyltransferase MiaA [Syntrophomonadaceae bacterium]|jgi:tRNA dimethylallyltransferase|nr:tRNA (adenosine(37)-N6)-dimethylallyltransferase MiaA [Syntrophomonadaceae bacterium]